MLVGTCQFAGWEDNRGSLVCCKGWHGWGVGIPSLLVPQLVSIPITKPAQAFPDCLTQDSDHSQSGEKAFSAPRAGIFHQIQEEPAIAALLRCPELMKEGEEGLGSHILPPRQHFLFHPRAQMNIPVFPGTAEPFPVSLSSQERFFCRTCVIN